MSAIWHMTTVKPPIVDPPRKEHCLKTSLQWTVLGTQKFCFPIVAIQFELPRRGQPLYIQGTKHVNLYSPQSSEVSLYFIF